MTALRPLQRALPSSWLGHSAVGSMDPDDVWGDDDGEFGSSWPAQSHGSTGGQRGSRTSGGSGGRGNFSAPQRRQPSATGEVDWDAWGSLRSVATPTVRPAPTVRPPAPAPAPRAAAPSSRTLAASRAASAQPAQQAAAAIKPTRGWGTVPAVQPVNILSPPREETVPAQAKQRQEPARPSEQDVRQAAKGSTRGGSRESHAGTNRKKDDGFGITPQQLSAIKRSFGQFAEGGLMVRAPERSQLLLRLACADNGCCVAFLAWKASHVRESRPAQPWRGLPQPQAAAPFD